MIVFDAFSISIFFLSVVIIGFIVRVFFVSQFIKEQGNKNYSFIENQLKLEIVKKKGINEKIILANRFNNSIMLKLFKITNELLLIQKLIFDKQP
jgi:hypothetical protein